MRTVLAVVLVLAWLGGAVYVAGEHPQVDASAQMQTAVQSPQTWLPVVKAAGTHLALTLAVFIFGGLIVGPLAFGRRKDGHFPWWAIAPVIALIIAGVAGLAAQVDGAPIVPWIILHGALGAYFCLSGALLAGHSAARKIAIVLLILPILGVAAGVMLVGRQALATDVLPVEIITVDAEQKRVLTDKLRQPTLVDPQTNLEQLMLSEEEVNQLLVLGMTLQSRPEAARILLEPSYLHLRGSRPAGANAYYTASLGARLAVVDGDLVFRVVSVRVGEVTVPDWLLAAAMPDIMAALRSEPRVDEILTALKSLQLSDQMVVVQLHGDALQSDFVSRLTGEQDEALNETARLYAKHLLAIWDGTPRGERTLENLLPPLFQLAAERSADGDPVHENRGAMLALGVVVGHIETQRLTGELLGETQNIKLAERVAATTRLRRRNDWARHFAISAMLTALASETLSDAIGLLKEEIDSAAGGSGFSFADLMADRAGTRLAAAATASPEQARRIQAFMSDSINVDTIFPEAADLPEGIPDERLQMEYGGVGGEGYQQVMQIIEQRLDALPIYSE